MKRFERYINGNYMVTIDTHTGTKIRENNLDFFDAEFPESFDLNITNCCDGGCPWCYQGCTPTGKHADLLSAKFFDSIHPYTEIAINGNDMSHPQLLEFLRKMREKEVIVNITVNQKHFERNKLALAVMQAEGLIHGIGVSLVDPTHEFIHEVQNWAGGIVIHTIAGVHDMTVFRKLARKNLKVLILGYKSIGRGVNYLKDVAAYNRTMHNINVLKGNLQQMIDDNWFEVLSFDNRAILQLDPKSCVSEEKWNEIFMGDDGIEGSMTSASMYIDLVAGKFARNSCEANRYDLMDNITDMYQFLKNN